MHDPLRVGVRDSTSDIANQRRHGSRRLQILNGPVEIAASHEFQRHVRQPVVLTGFEYLHDIRMREPRDGLGFDAKPRDQLGVGMLCPEDHLQGDNSLESFIAGAIDDPHSAAAEEALNRVAGNRDRSRRARHIGCQEGSRRRFRDGHFRIRRLTGINRCCVGIDFSTSPEPVARTVPFS